ncbi:MULTISPECIES: restriction endonuclease subunit S [Klebsiella]|nr:MULTISPECIES: restriction endonuclease subunit S [Klebsiella]MDK1925340.1 restriction endonuclease subunit S [Klebsiella sp. K4-41]SSK05560.1 Restriction modification system DNA specificity domain protein [Klebsiella pneumoniae]
MSEMSYLEKLLDGVEVEWLSLSKVFNLRNGYTPSKTKKEFWENGDIPWFRMDDIRENGRILGNSLQRISSCAVKGGELFPENSILISTSATIGEHALITVPHLANQRFTCLALKESYVDCFDIKFLFYYCFSLAEWCRKNTTMSSFASVDMDGFKKFLIPLPCPDNPEKSLAIQSEIVRILDKFTALTAELTAELTARKKQYNYYRDQLLSFDEEQEKHIYLEKLLDGVEVEWKTLGEVAKYVRGLIYSKSSESADGQGYKVLRANNITLSNNCLNLNDVKVVRFDTKVKSSQKLYKNDILISAASGSREHVGKVAYIESDIDYYFGGFMGVVRCDEKLNPRYLFHVLTSDIFQKYLDEMLNSSTINNLNSAVMGRFKIPLPCPDTPEKSLAIQSEIVRILDKFDTLTNSITEGLPREIELRQKQYEYYRDLLFSFPKPDSVTN